MKSFEEINAEFHNIGLKIPPIKQLIRIDNAKERINTYFTHFLQGEKLKWIPAYDEVAEWLTDNKGRGLFLYGQCGLGKTMLAQYILPAIIQINTGKKCRILDAVDINTDDRAILYPFLSIDDIGTEEVQNRYGNKRLVFAEIMDRAEKKGNLLIITTNLTIEEIREKYGDRVLDRIKSTTKRVLFEGKSFRN